MNTKTTKINQAIEKITKECEGNQHLVPFEEYLTSICNDKVADKILSKDKTLKGCFESMKAIAQRRAHNGAAYIPPEEGFEIIRDYYGISDDDLKQHEADSKSAKVINIMDLM